MFARTDQDATKVYQGQPIQLQGFNSRTSDVGQSKYLGCIVRPRKVVRPAVPPGMKQQNGFPRNGISSLRSIVLVIVAALARQRQIAGRTLAVAASRSNVLQGETLMGKCSGAAAILAISLGAANDKRA